MGEAPIHLDTSFLIRAMARRSAEDLAIREWLESGRPLAMSSVAWAEFRCGPLEPPQLELAARIVSERVPFIERDAVLAAELFNRSGRRRGSLIDCMIGGTALRSGAVLATTNRAAFKRLGVELALSLSTP